MSDAKALPREPLQPKLVTSESIHHQLRKIGRLEEKGRRGFANRRRHQLIVDVLTAIADGSVENPGEVAAVLVTGLRASPGAGKPAARRRTAMPSKAAGTFNNKISGKALLERAESIVDKVALPAAALDTLYDNSRYEALPRNEWERRVRVACAIDQLLRTSFRHAANELLDELVEHKEMLRVNPGTLLLTTHAGFVLIARRLFGRVLKDEHIVGRGGTINTKGNERGALFVALRALQDGRVMMMAPDGPDGKQTGSLNVLGRTSSAGEGAAYIAYASACNTAWYTVVRQGDKFVPVVKSGPARSEKETLEQFRDRLYDFYSQQIENTLTGDPDNIVLRPRWSRVFHEGKGRFKTPRQTRLRAANS